MPRLEITLYDQDNEPSQNFVRTFVPWKMLKRAIRLSKTLNAENMTEENVDELADFIVDVFGNRFTVEDLNNGADVGEMMTVLESIMSTASGSDGNPNPPPKG